MLLPRERLFLSALDLDNPHGDFPDNRLFESKIKILELEGRLGSNVLLARSETSRIVYAIEHESNGLYVLCKLGPWVDIQALAESATVVCRERICGNKPIKSENTAAVPLMTPLMYKENKRRRLAMDELQLLVQRRPSTAIDRASQDQTPTPAEERPGSRGANSQSAKPAEEPVKPPADQLPSLSGGRDPQAPHPAPGDDLSGPPNAQDIFQNVRTQYLEALYHSKVSGFLHIPHIQMCTVLTEAGVTGVFRERSAL
jgi:DNA replication regulator SLD3